jgi:L-alanine-DL-glutamate epimerase-like enolase superfamily enzyme
MVRDAKSFVNDGFDIIKIKLGLDPADDITRVSAIRTALGNHIELIVDANQGWSTKDALTVIRSLEHLQLNISLIEQPVRATDLVNLKYIRDNVTSSIIADEACFSALDALNIVKNNAADGLNIKLMKCGGLNNANAIYNIAKAANMHVMAGSMLESPIGVAAIASFVVSKTDILYADLDPLALIRENYILGGATLKGNKIILSDKPGLGIEGFSQGYTFLDEIIYK